MEKSTYYYGLFYAFVLSNSSFKGKIVFLNGTDYHLEEAEALAKDLGACKIIRGASSNIPEHSENIQILISDGVNPIKLDEFPNLECVCDLREQPYRTKLIFDAERRQLFTVSGAFVRVSASVMEQAFLKGETADPKEISSTYTKELTKNMNLGLLGLASYGILEIANILAGLMGRPVLLVKEQLLPLMSFEELHGVILVCDETIVTHPSILSALSANSTLYFISSPLEELQKDVPTETKEHQLKAYFKEFRSFCDSTYELRRDALQAAEDLYSDFCKHPYKKKDDLG